MKKVLYVSNRTGFSGAEVVLLRIVQNNKHVIPVLMAPQGLMAEKFQDLGVKVYLTNFFKQTNRKHGNHLWLIQILLNQVLGSLELAFIIIRERPDVVHANGLGAAIYASFPSKLLFRPFVWTDHDVFELGSIEAGWTKRISPFSDRVVAVSNFVERNLVSMGVPPEKTLTIYNGLDLNFFDSAKVDGGRIKQMLNLGNNVKIISLFALITRWKGHHVVIDAAKILVERKIKNFSIVFVGATDDEKYKAEMVRKLSSLGLKSVVHFIGFVSNVRGAYRDTDVLLNSSIKPEPFGTTIYEGMAMEKVVIATNIGGNPEIVQDGKTGFLVDPSNAKELADKITYVLTNLDKLETLRKSARRRVMEELSLNQMIDNYNSLYKSL
jgi:glycosyltransferase involved in cell wall biosynthesis